MSHGWETCMECKNHYHEAETVDGSCPKCVNEKTIKEAVVTGVQIASARQRVFDNLDKALDYIKFCKAQRVYVELQMDGSYVVQTTGSQGEQV